MVLQSVLIKNFRSSESLTMEGCSRLNVLIGKNNAGKSNILSALHAVFLCIKGGLTFSPKSRPA
jgi:putative ATP-dependent endonuclease of the OLD family